MFAGRSTARAGRQRKAGKDRMADLIVVVSIAFSQVRMTGRVRGNNQTRHGFVPGRLLDKRRRYRVRRGFWTAFNFFQPQLEGLDFSLQFVDLDVETFHAYAARRFSAI
jgi:hypothetical protein